MNPSNGYCYSTSSGYNLTTYMVNYYDDLWNIREFRISSHLQKRRAEELRFISDLEEILVNLGYSRTGLPQFSAPIEDRELWINTQRIYNCDYSPNLYNKNMRSFDYFINGWAIEADYSSTHKVPEIDQASDEYFLISHNIRTKRFKDYASKKISEEQQVKNKNDLTDFLQEVYTTSWTDTPDIGFETTRMNAFGKYYESELGALKTIRSGGRPRIRNKEKYRELLGII